MKFKFGDPLKELEEKGREDRARIVQNLFKLLEEMKKKITELLKIIDEEDIIEGTTLEDGGLKYWTRRGKEIYVDKNGSITVRSRNGTYFIGERIILL